MTQDTTLQNSVAQGLLIIIAPPDLEETLIDILLQKTEISGFTTSNVSGHGSSHGEGVVKLSIAEQVTGRQRRVQFMTHAVLVDLQNLVASLKVQFKNTDIHYILMPIAEIPA
ncbi:MAG: DUF3240 family protein [Methylotenera sp.]|nr:DUF3240 family protein [Methylotenera sp.]MDD4926321.1 DUF3240 family protein [Methylotenera sp.]NOS95129.1 DUF3240 family protein [Methylotenera sp.]NOU40731.1 DUF3240 family protein [Methylotenera sp.]